MSADRPPAQASPSSSTRRVLKSIVAPALGRSLAALLATTPVVLAAGLGCHQEVAKDSLPVVGMLPAPSAVDAGAGSEAQPTVGDVAPPSSPDAGAAQPIPRPGMPPKPGLLRPPPGPPRPGTSPKVGIRAPSDAEGRRPSRPPRRATDPDATALKTGLVGGATRKLQ